MIFVNISDNIIYLQPMDNQAEVNDKSQKMCEIIPQYCYCTITGKLMVDPVVTPNGDTYERAAIEEWLTKKGTCPVTRTPVTIASLIPNRAMKELIQKKASKELKSQIEEDRRIAATAKPKPLPAAPTTTTQWVSIRQTTSSFANVREVALFGGSLSQPAPERNPLQSEVLRRVADIRARQEEDARIRRFREQEDARIRQVRQQESQMIAAANTLSSIITTIRRTVNPTASTVYIDNVRDWPDTLPIFPVDADFSFITCMGTRREVSWAYCTMNRIGKWAVLRVFEPNSERGFTMERDNEEIVNIMTEIDKDYNGHSGLSLGYTMRIMHYISRYGVDKYKEYYLSN
jgi:hypothetical protein